MEIQTGPPAHSTTLSYWFLITGKAIPSAETHAKGKATEVPEEQAGNSQKPHKCQGALGSCEPSGSREETGNLNMQEIKACRHSAKGI